MRLSHLRNGAFSWRLHEDLVRPNTYRVEMMYPSWTEYLLMQERLAKNEREIIDKARRCHVGEKVLVQMLSSVCFCRVRGFAFQAASTAGSRPFQVFAQNRLTHRN